jgi:hypothetical protein
MDSTLSESVLATSNADGRPQSTVIFVKRDGEAVVFSTIKGRIKTPNVFDPLADRAHGTRHRPEDHALRLLRDVRTVARRIAHHHHRESA